MLEKDITAAILRYLHSLPGSFCWKEHGGPYGTNGIPDIICCYHGRFVALEVKTPEGKLSDNPEIQSHPWPSEDQLLCPPRWRVHGN